MRMKTAKITPNRTVQEEFDFSAPTIPEDSNNIAEQDKHGDSTNSHDRDISMEGNTQGERVITPVSAIISERVTLRESTISNDLDIRIDSTILTERVNPADSNKMIEQVTLQESTITRDRVIRIDSTIFSERVIVTDSNIVSDRVTPSDSTKALELADYIEQIARDTATLRMDETFWAPSKQFYIDRIEAYRESARQLSSHMD